MILSTIGQLVATLAVLNTFVLVNGAVVNRRKLSNSNGPVEYAPIVQLSSGKVRGVVRQGAANQKVYFYQGIRYGRAQRFELPVAEQPWTEVYNATRVRYACPQPGKRPGKLVDDESLVSTDVSSEDCLFLNVWQPANKPQTGSNRTVMFWIYGGSFHSGTIFDGMFDSSQLATLGDVVVVAVNYRVGPFGFFDAGTEKEPGNLGLYDQILGLEWVRQNIHHFGGNPDEVTIFGESAGSFSVGALVLSPSTKGLFKRAILQSGAPNAYLGSESRNVSLTKTKKFADRFGCPSGQGKQTEMLACLRAKTVNQILDVSSHEIENAEIFLPNFGSALLPTSPVQALKEFNRDIDLLYGLVRNEGSGFVGPILSDFDSETSVLTLEETKGAITLILALFELSHQEEIIEHYTKHLTDNSTKQQFRDAVGDVFGDYHLVCPTVLFGEHVAMAANKHGHQANRFYAYRVMQRPKHIFGSCHPWMGVCHGGDLIFLFGHPLMENNSSEQDRKLSRDMISAWTQFAKTGQIGPISGMQWTEAVDRSVANASTRYLSLGSQYRMVDDYWTETCHQLWKPIIFV